MRIHREGFRYIIYATLIWLLVLYASWHLPPGIVWLFCLINFGFFIFWCLIIWFFRIPKRDMVQGESFAVAPADGKVVIIEEVYEPEYYKENRLQMSIFMSPLNVHVNRNPISGIIRYMKYHPGKYLVAWHPKSSTLNERTTIVIENDRASLLVRQIAGAVARRIKYYIKEGDEVKQNEELGFIRFGSRVDVYFPLGTKPDVKVGDIVKGGITILAHL